MLVLLKIYAVRDRNVTSTHGKSLRQMELWDEAKFVSFESTTNDALEVQKVDSGA